MVGMLGRDQHPEPTLYRHARLSYLLDEIKRVGLRWQVLLGATIAYWLGSGLVQNVQELVIASIARDLRLSFNEIWRLTIVGLVAYLLCALPAGALAVRFDARRLVSAGLAVMALGMLGMALAGGWPSLAIARIVSSGAGALVVVPALALNARAASPRRAAIATGLVLALAGFATTRLGDLALIVMMLDSLGGWRAIVVGACPVLVLAAVACWPLLRDPGRRPGASGASTPSLSASLPAAGRLRALLLLGLVSLMSLMSGPLIIMQASGSLGLSPIEAIASASAMRPFGLIGPLLAGTAADRFGPRPVLLVLVGLQMLALALPGFGGGLVVLWLIAALVFFAALGIMTVVIATAGAVPNRALAPASVGLMVLALSAGELVGQALLDTAGVSGGPGGVLSWPTALALVANVLALLVVVAVPRPPAEAPDSP